MTQLIGYKFNNDATKRMMRRNRSKLDDSLTYKTADEKKIRLKPMIVTRGRAQGGTRSELRKRMKEHLTNTIAKTNYEQLMRDIIQGKFQRAMQDALRKTFPVTGSEVRNIELIIPKKRL